MRGAAALVLLAWAAFAALALAVHGERALSWDEPVTDAVSALFVISDDEIHANPAVWAVTVGLGVAVAALAAWHALRRRLRPVLFAAVAAGGTVVLIELAKLLITRPVIEGSGDGSFPSGTAAWTLAAASVCALLLQTRWAVIAAAVVVLALSGTIVWERWHYPSDVLGGWLLAAAWVATAWLALGSSEREGGGRLLREHPSNRQ